MAKAKSQAEPNDVSRARGATAKGRAAPARDTEDSIAPASGPARRATAEAMATRQREISVSEFFTKNRHLLGFDNPAKALLTTVKEAVDNSLDACEEAGILPEIIVEIVELAAGDASAEASRDRFRVVDRGQRARHRQAADPENLREASLRIEVPPAQAVARAAGHRHQRRGPLRAAHDGQARRHHEQDGQGPARVPDRAPHRHEAQPARHRRRDETRSSGTRSTARASRSSSSRPIAAVARASQEYLEQTVVANPHLALTYLSAEGRAARVPARDRTSCRARRRRSSRTRTASSSGCCSRCCRTRRARR